jgi:hypothetical protein
MDTLSEKPNNAVTVVPEENNTQSLEPASTADASELLKLTLDDVFINLTLLSKIEVGNKLFQNGKYINIDNSYFSFLSRWFYGNNRRNTMTFISQVLNKAFEYVEYYSTINKKDTSNRQHALRLNNELKNSIDGLTNLKLTYNYDKLIQSEIDVMIENIRSKLDLYIHSYIERVIDEIPSSSNGLCHEKREIPEKKEKKYYPVPYDK